MRYHMTLLFVLGVILCSCARPVAPTSSVPGPDAPFPPTWTPTVVAENTPTATLVVRPTPTWDGALPPPSEAEVPRIVPSKLYRELESDAYAVVDLRTLAEYNQAHILEAVHIPSEELPDRIADLDGNKTIVFYDLSPNDTASLAAAMYLYDLGYSKVVVLDGGLQRWYSEGYPVEGTLLTPTPGVRPPGSVTPLATSTALPTATRTSTSTPVTPTSTSAR